MIFLSDGTLPSTFSPMPVSAFEEVGNITSLIIFIIIVPSVFPQIHRKKRNLTLLGDWSASILGGDKFEFQTRNVINEPKPTTTEEGHGFVGDFLLECLERFVLLFDGGLQVRGEVDAPRSDALPEEHVIVVLGGVVEDGLVLGVFGGAADDLVEGHAVEGGAFDELVELVDVGAVVAAVVEAELLGSEEGLAAAVHDEVEAGKVEEALILDEAFLTAAELVDAEVHFTPLGDVVVGDATGFAAHVLVFGVEGEFTKLNILFGVVELETTTNVDSKLSS